MTEFGLPLILLSVAFSSCCCFSVSRGRASGAGGLKRRGWTEAAVIAASSAEEAERRFLETALAAPAPASAPKAVTPSSAQPVPAGVIGLFPEPGARR